MEAHLKHRVIGAAFAGIAASRADLWLAPFARGAGAILMFHHVRPRAADPFAPNALLEITPEHLDRTLGLVREMGCDIVPLASVPERLAAPGRRPFVALTFDDGYRDNVAHALPVLRRHDAPWTLFVASDYASGRGQLWWLELEEVVRASPRLVLEDGRQELVLPAGTLAEKRAAFAAAYARLRAGPEDALRATIARWMREIGLESGDLVRRLCLGWDDLARLAEIPGVTIGAHTMSHPMLAKHSAEIVRREIEGSRAAIAHRLGTVPRLFAYPVGDPTSAGPREFEMARQLGFDLAVTTRPGHVFAGHAGHPTALPRVSVNGLHQTGSAMRALLSGVSFLLWNRGRRVNVG